MKNAGPRFLTHTYTQGCLLYSMYVWAQGPTQACWSIRMTVFPPLLCSHEDCVFAAVYRGVDLRDEASCMYMSACWASCDAQVLDILTLNSSCWSLWCRMFWSGATCVPLVCWNELFVYKHHLHIRVWTLCTVVGWSFTSNSLHTLQYYYTGQNPFICDVFHFPCQSSESLITCNCRPC